MISEVLQKAAGIDLAPSAKAALGLADSIERRLAEGAWDDGHMLGTEEQLAQRHRVSPVIARQTMRVLESRDLGFIRRGRAGGFVLHRPSPATLGYLMAVHLSGSGVRQSEVRHARLLLADTLPHRSEAADLAEALLASIDNAMQQADAGGTPAYMRNRALNIAQRMLADHPDPCASLGSIDAMGERYVAGRPIIVQAIRILEQLDMLTASRGRNGGLRRQAPSVTAVVKAVCPHLRARRVSLDACHDLVWAINQTLAVMVADRGDDAVELRRLRDRLADPQAAATGKAAQVAMFRLLAELAHAPVLHLLVRCLWFYKEDALSPNDTALVSLNRMDMDAMFELARGIGNGRSGLVAPMMSHLRGCRAHV